MAGGTISHPQSGALGPAWSRVTPRHFCVAGVALGDIHLDFTWQAWHNLTSTVVLRGRRGTHGTGWRAWARLVASDAAALCVAGVALGDIHLDFTWQAWHNLTSTVVLRGRRGTHGTGWRAWARLVARDAAALCVAGVALGHIMSHPPSFCVAGVALMALGWLWWHAWAGFGRRCNFVTHHLSHTTLSYNFVTHHLSHPPLSHTIFHIQLCHTPSFTYPIYRRFARQAWHKLTSTIVLRGRRGTHGTGWRAWARLVARDAAAFCVAGVALGDIHLDFTWQAWHNLTSTVVLRGRRGTHGTGWHAWACLVARDAAALCVAGVALGDIHLDFTWQAWHNLTSTEWRAWARLVARDAAALLHGRRGTW